MFFRSPELWCDRQAHSRRCDRESIHSSIKKAATFAVAFFINRFGSEPNSHLPAEGDFDGVGPVVRGLAVPITEAITAAFRLAGDSERTRVVVGAGGVGFFANAWV